MTRYRTLFARAAAVTILSVSWQGFAQTPSSDNAINAKLLQHEAAKLMQAKDYRHACPKLAEAVQLAPDSTDIVMALAACYEGQDKLASAWKHYVVATELTSRTGQTSLLEQARARVDVLEGKLARLTLNIPLAVKAIPNVSVRVGAVLMQESTWGAAIPVDKGSTEVTVQAPGYDTWGRTVVATQNGETVEVKVEVPSEAKKKSEEKSSFVIWPPGLVIGGVGIVGIVAGSLSGIAAVSNKAIVDANCVRSDNGSRLCNANGIAAVERTDRFALLSTINMTVGIGALTAGIILIAIKGKPPEKPPVAAGIRMDIVGPWGTGFGLRGVF